MSSLNIKYITGNLLDSDAPIIAHQVNCEGVMGAGVAKYIREKYFDIMITYSKWCKNYTTQSLLGKVLDYFTDTNQIIVNCFAQAKTGSGRMTNYEAFYTCLENLKDEADYYGDCYGFEHRIAFPYKIGCGLGGGDWEVILAMIKSVFGRDGDYTIEFWAIDGFGDDIHDSES